MAINGNRIVVTTVHRDGIKGTPPPVCGEIVPVAPPVPYFSPNGSEYSQPAEYQGQVKFVETDNDQVYTMYVVVNVGSSIIDGGNFTTGISLGEDGDLYDGGNFTIGRSIAADTDIIDGDSNVASNLVLEWKPCGLFSRTIDPRTGEPYDPLAEFYHPLAN